MAIRFVEETNEIRTEEAAEHFVLVDTGRAVIPTGRTKRIPGGFAVEVFSMDGRPSAMFTTGATIKTNSETPATRDMPDVFPDLAEFDSIPGLEPEGDLVMDKNKRREKFRVVSIEGNEAVVAYDSDNFEIVVPTVDLNSAKPGEQIEGVVIGMGEGLREVFIFGRERLVEIFPGFERVPYKGASSEEKGWAPYSNPAPPAGKERK